MSKVIVALDFQSDRDALQFVEKIDPTLCKLKVGVAMFTRYGQDFVKGLIQKGFDIFLDLKFHDIPNTVAEACKAAADLGAWMVSVHAVGGFKMLQAAHNAVSQSAHKPKLVAITVLTSMEGHDLNEVGTSAPIKDQVLKLAQLAHEANFDGAVCSAEEAQFLRKSLGNDFCLVTPGIRLENSPKDDQKRIVTPKLALLAGADYLVIGRPITQAENPRAVLEGILA